MKLPSVNAAVAAAGKLIDRIKSDANAARILTEWIGSGGDPVSKDVAARRAETCVACPHNQPGAAVEARVAEVIREQDALRRGHKLTVPNEGKLNSCNICGCYLKLKVWVPMKHLAPRTRMRDFPETCWLPIESQARRKELASETKAPVAVVAAKRELPKPVKTPKRIIRIRRTAAHGDVLMASTLATKLFHLGFEIHFVTAEACRETLANHPHIARVVSDDLPVDVDLDGTYEGNLERNRKSIALLFTEAAQHRLPVKVDSVNLRPIVNITDDERMEAFQRMQAAGPRPWTVFIRRSFSWPNRTLDQREFVEAVNAIRGTVFCAQNDEHPDSNAKPLVHVKWFRQLMASISIADLVVTPDTGPLHVAAALGKQIVVMEQCNDTAFRVNDQTDWWSVGTGLECAPCHEFTCKIDAKRPPCQKVSGARIAEAANTRLAAQGAGRVSAVIPVYNVQPRLERCIKAVESQVDEVVVALDGDAKFHRGNVFVVPSPGKRTGYGKTCNRGARASANDWLLFLNDDCYLNPGAVKSMLDAADEKTAVVGCLLWYPDKTIQHAGKARRRADIGFGHMDYRKLEPTITKPRECEDVTFAAALVRRQAFYEVAAFDERYDCYSEDTDLCMKVRRAGWKVMFTPHAQGIHDESQSTSPMKQELLRSGTEIFRQKWEPYFRNNPPGKPGTNWEGTK